MNTRDEMDWEEVEDAAANIFNVWYGGSELAWAKEVWEHFGKAGMNQASSVLDRTKINLRLLTLGRIYHEFCGCAWDENPDRPIDFLADNFDIDHVALGILAAEAGLNDCDYIDDDGDLRELALIEACDGMRSEIFTCLIRTIAEMGALRAREDDRLRRLKDFATAVSALNKGMHSIIAPACDIQFDHAAAIWAAIYVSAFAENEKAMKTEDLRARIGALVKLFRLKFFVASYHSKKDS